MKADPSGSCEWTNCPTRVGSVCCKEEPCKTTKRLSTEQRKALIESACNDADEDGLLPDMQRFAWLIDAVERAHGIS